MQLISDALRGMIIHHPDFSPVDGHCSLSNMIAAVHVMYQSTISEIVWFEQLSSQMPGILEPLQDSVPHDSPEMVSSDYCCSNQVILICNLQVLHLCAVERALSSLDPEHPLHQDEGTMIRWLNDVRLSQNTVDSILSIPSENDICKRARYVCRMLRFWYHLINYLILINSRAVLLLVHCFSLCKYRISP